MVDDLTVLLVSQAEPDVALGSELEKQNLAVEYSDVKEFKSLMALVEPALVVHIGQEGAEQTVNVLRENKDERRVRLLVLADRKDLVELRKLDRSVVVSLLATDIAQPVIATRIVMLAKKGPEKTFPPSASMAAKLPLSIPTHAKQPTVTLSAAPRAPAPAVAPVRPGIPGPTSKAQAPAVSMVSKPAPPPKTLEVPPKISAAPKNLSPPVAPPRAVSKGPLPGANPGVSAGLSPLPAPVKRPLNIPVREAKAPEPGPSPHEAVTLSPAATSPAQAPPPPALSQKALSPRADSPPRATSEAPSSSTTARAVVAETNMTRGDLIACALRDAGIETRLVPLDVAQTNWPVVRAFGPTLVLADGHSLKGSGQVWLQLFQADQALRSAKIVAVPFERLCNEQEGVVNLRMLIPQIPQLSADARHAPEDTRVTRPPPAPTPSAEVDEDDRPTFIGGGIVDLQMDEETVATDVSKMVAEIQGKRSEGPKMPPPPVNIEEIAELDPVPPSNPPEVASPAIDLYAHVGKAAAAANQATTVEKRSGGGARFALAGLLLAAAAGGGFFLYKKHSAKEQSGTQASALDAPAQETTAEVAQPAEEVQDGNQPPVLSGDPLWAIGPEQEMKSCDEVVVDLAAVKAGGVQRAALAWSKARKALMLGGYDEAHVLLCEASLGHDESLAIEELVELYLIKHQPALAERWIAEAQKVRPERVKTLELVGDVYSQKGDPAQAKTVWVTALKVPETDQKTLDLVAKQYVEHATLRLRSGGISAAESLLRRAATLSPTNADAAAGMAAVYAGTAYKETAKAWAAKALSLRDGHPEALAVLADLETAAGNEKEALALYKKILEVDPNHKHARLRVYSMEGESGLAPSLPKPAPTRTPTPSDAETEPPSPSTETVPSPTPAEVSEKPEKPSELPTPEPAP